MIADGPYAVSAVRTAAIERAVDEGRKIVGYLPGPYVPEELIYASGALPVCLANGGSARVADHALSVFPPALCPFARAQVGEMLLKDDPAYAAVDMVVVPSTCQHLRKVGDLWGYREPGEVFKLGVPYDPEEPLGLTFYRNRLSDLKARLERLTGVPITETSLAQAIGVYDRLRRALREISLLRRTDPPALSGLEFVLLNHASLYGDPVEVGAVLEAFLHERRAAIPPARTDVPSSRPEALSANIPTGAAAHAPTGAQVNRLVGAPRVMLIGPNIAVGDHAVVEVVEGAGANVVIEDVFEGLRDYWGEVGECRAHEDTLEILARTRLVNRTPAAFMRSSAGPRFEVVSKLIRDFKVSGVIWYELLCCEFYDQDAFFFEHRLREMGIPMLIIESNYDDVRSGPVFTRIEAFLEIVKGGPAYA